MVSDLEKSKKFYKSLFGLEVVVEQEGNIVLTEGLVLQNAGVWENVIGRDISYENCAAELYFEERDLTSFSKKIEEYEEKIQVVTPLQEYPWGQKVIRLYDLDGHLIEVRTPM